MLEKVFHGEDLPSADRFAYWYEMTTKAYVPTVMDTRHRSDFRAETEGVNLRSMQIFASVHSPLACRRTARMIRKSDPDMYIVGLIRNGGAIFSQEGRSVILGVQDFLLFDTSRPFWTESDAEDGACAEITIHLPKSLLPLPSRMMDDLISRRLPGGEGMRSLLRVNLEHLISGHCRLQSTDLSRVEGVLLDLITSAMADELGAGSLVPPEMYRTALAMRIRAFIEQHLGDPWLSPSSIAEAHHISLRYLQRIFQQDDQTVTGWIRRRRLERCRRDLADPLLTAQPVHAVAAMWGFSHPQHFSRAFRADFGMSPQEYRRAARSGEA